MSVSKYLFRYIELRLFRTDISFRYFNFISTIDVPKFIYSRPDRLRPIADRFGLDQNAVLENVLYARAYTSEHQVKLVIGINFNTNSRSNCV